MPVEADQLEVINAALLLIGDNPIEALADLGEREDLANGIYEIRVAEALGRARWRFATGQVQLALNVETPLARWSTSWALPDGDPDPVVQVIHAVTVDDVPIAFDRYGQNIYCNAGAEDQVFLDYAFRAEEADWMGNFKGAFVDLLAADFAASKDKDLSAHLARRAEDKFKVAAGLEAQARTSRQLPVLKFARGRRFWAPGMSSGAIAGAGQGGGTIIANLGDGNYGVITIIDGVWYFTDTFSIGTSEIEDEAVTLAKMADGDPADIIIYDATGRPILLGVGNEGDVLTVDSGYPTWVPPGVASLVDDSVTLAKMAHGTAGDIIYMASGGGAPTYLAAGTDGDRLEMVSGLPGWVTPGSAGAGWQLIASASPAAVSAVDFTGLSGYIALRLVGYDITQTADTALWLRTSTNNGSTFATGSTSYDHADLRSGGTAAVQDTFMQVGSENDASTNDINFTADLIGFNTATAHTMLRALFYTVASGGAEVAYAGKRNAAEANNALRVGVSSGTFSGTLRLYGMEG